MNIYFIITSLENLGGTERVATNLANNLANYHDITILCRFSETVAYPVSNNVEVLKIQGTTWNFISRVKKTVKKNSPDIVIVHTMSKLTPILLLGGLKANQIWSLEHISFEFHSFIFQSLRRLIYNKSDKVITLTEADKQNYKLFHQNTVVIPNATPLEIKDTNDELSSTTSKTIVSVGRLTHQKGYDLLIKAWYEVVNNCDESKNWTLCIYGKGEEKQNIIQLIDSYELSNVHLMGLTSNIQSVYDESDFYVMSSRYEGLPMVLIEAQSRGLPIVSFDCPSGPSEIVEDKKNGYLVENGNISKLAMSIATLIEDKETKRRFSSESLKSVRRYSIDKIIEEWLKQIEMVKNDYIQ